MNAFFCFYNKLILIFSLRRTDRYQRRTYTLKKIRSRFQYTPRRLTAQQRHIIQGTYPKKVNFGNIPQKNFFFRCFTKPNLPRVGLRLNRSTKRSAYRDG